MSDQTIRPKNQEPPAGQSGGIHIGGDMVAPGSNIAGGDQTIYSGAGTSGADLARILAPLLDAARAAPPEKRAQAETKVTAIHEELKKGKDADDNRLGGLLEDLTKMLPDAIKTVVTVFGNPILAGLAGPVTKFVLSRLGAG